MLWWDPNERIAWELAQLAEHGYEFQPPLRITLPFTIVVDADVGGERHALEVDFPPLYPYFRFELRAPTLTLPHHQHLLSKNLCLMPRGTDHWDMSNSLAWYLDTQLPKVIAAGTATDTSEAAALEEEQAEPVTDYFVYRNDAMLLIDGSWRLPDDFVTGTIVAFCDRRQERTDPLRGTIMKVFDCNGSAVFEAPAHLDRGGDVVRGYIVKLQDPVIEENPANLHARLKNDFFPGEAEERTSILAVIMPEEHARRDASGQGWLFIVTDKKYGSYFARAGRAGSLDLRARAPELAGLPASTIALFGLGCIGGISAVEFAKAGTGALRMLDHDYLDSGTLLRWYLGLPNAGLAKAPLLAMFLKKNYPLTTATAHQHALGRFGEDEAILNHMTAGTSLIYDAAAEPGVSYFLAELARHRGIAFVHVSATNGGWGGLIVRLTTNTGCWYCFKAAQDRHDIPDPPEDKSVRLQPQGCADPTFTGANFDLATIALDGVRTGIASLNSTYPSQSWDVMVVALRDEHGALIPPRFDTYALPKDPTCPMCGSA